ncbi:lycopene beta-cyclase [Gillisia sp. Hel_I_86]|uniref:lycopene cyclase family protein n=1 Tax=Gillisia sp. Hel_I_86 TaxID=1249981 RepID=UPI00119A6B9D|nr:lycopene cyclase family protein [Gillisia sp. Hel_I_86]TVZ27456.1 lycopene beta-cyclase [Gillisia sp. Hel_I_86]
MPQNFDYIIIGSGLAGLQLAYKLSEDPFFGKSQIAIIDPSSKETNDKTWCFWEKGTGKWDEIITKSWDQAKFISTEANIDLELNPYSYKMLRAIDFYNFVRSALKGKSNFHFILDEVGEIDEINSLAFGKKDNYAATHFFDSRIGSDYLENSKSTKIFQHFKGLRITTTNPVFDEAIFTMMDFRLKFPESTSFTYVLPLSEREALIEYTFFTPFLIEEPVYDTYLQTYIKDILKIEDHEIIETEKGVIPMTDYNFHEASGPKVTKIGTAGSWVKGSTGYSFKHTEKKTAQLVQNIKSGKNPKDGLLNARSRWYDAIFLDVLHRNNELGEQVFTKFYSNNTPQEIFKYLDEETNILEELKIMFSIYHPEFVRSFFRKLFQ